MEKHINILGTLYIVFGLMSLAAGVFVFIILMLIGVFSGDNDAAFVLPIVATGIATVMIVTSAPGILGGIGLLKRKKWARILMIIIGALNLLSFPIGTILGVYTLWVLLKNDADCYFSNKNYYYEEPCQKYNL